MDIYFHSPTAAVNSEVLEVLIAACKSFVVLLLITPSSSHGALMYGNPPSLRSVICCFMVQQTLLCSTTKNNGEESEVISGMVFLSLACRYKGGRSRKENAFSVGSEMIFHSTLYILLSCLKPDYKTMKIRPCSAPIVCKG